MNPYQEYQKAYKDLEVAERRLLAAHARLHKHDPSAAALAVCGGNPQPLPEAMLAGEVDFSSSLRWEVVSDQDGQMHRVRWSEPNNEHEYFYVAHYPKKYFAERHAERLNAEGRKPWEWQGYHPTMEADE